MKKKITIVGFGNSITEAKTRMPDENKRWLKILERKLSEFCADADFTVINSGIGGNSAREAMARFDRDVLAHSPDYVLLEFGGNNNDPARPERRVPPEEFRGLLKRFREGLPAKTKVVVITFPPVFRDLHSYWKNPLHMEYLQSSLEKMGVEAYIKITKEFAEKSGYPLYDFHRELLELGKINGREKYTQDDGVHLTEDGNMVLAEGVFEKLKNMIKQKGI
ncbi:MAG: hypothetical protein A2017_03830 [Lentisphaerae bacterium GWF2_44_16]|nr:MAG: hypothetical protein A2017_03830 [Lentisphaerae bacterium GWF2_44_16]